MVSRFNVKYQWRRFCSCVVLAAFLATGNGVPLRYASAQEAMPLPIPGTRLTLSPAFAPPLLKGIKVYRNDPLKFDFILDNGDLAGNGRDRSLQDETTRLIKYFLAALTVPEKDLWVNLSPYEKDRIVPDAFGRTEMGRDLLAQDYILKQITASVIYPEGETGKAFWGRVYAEAQQRFGTTDIPVDAFNKVWIIPEKATVYENKDAAFVVESRLKVMLETDYMATSVSAGTPSTTPLPTAGHEAPQGIVSPSTRPPPQGVNTKAPQVATVADPALNATNDIAKAVLREIVIPILEKEVNEGQNFAPLRQVYSSLILATWYKRKIMNAITHQHSAGGDLVSARRSADDPMQYFVDQNKTAGIDISDKNGKEKIWARYVDAFKKGAYTFIKEEPDPLTGEIVPRKYFSGGANMAMTALKSTTDAAVLPRGGTPLILINLRADMAMTSGQALRVDQVMNTGSVDHAGLNADVLVFKNDRLEIKPLTLALLSRHFHEIFELFKLIKHDNPHEIQREMNYLFDRKNYDPELGYAIFDPHGKVVGYSIVCKAPYASYASDSEISLERLSIDPHYQRTGVSTWLIYRTFLNAKRHGYANARWSTVRDDNQAALDFYAEKVGARRIWEVGPREVATIPNIWWTVFEVDLETALIRLQERSQRGEKDTGTFSQLKKDEGISSGNVENYSNAVAQTALRFAVATRSMSHGSAIFGTGMIGALSGLDGDIGQILKKHGASYDFTLMAEHLKACFSFIGVMNRYEDFSTRKETSAQEEFVAQMKVARGHLNVVLEESRKAFALVSRGALDKEIFNGKPEDFWMLWLVEDPILKLESRIEMAEGIASERQFSVGDLVDNLKAYGNYGAPVDYQVDEALHDVMIPGNMYTLQSALRNLLVNASDAITGPDGKVPEGVKIELRMSFDGGKFLIGVRDHGPGIAGIDNIFELNKTTKGEGHGLGLTEVKLAVEDMKGTVRAFNHAPQDGGGARFIMELPVPDTAMKVDRAMATDLKASSAANLPERPASESRSLSLTAQRFGQDAMLVDQVHRILADHDEGFPGGDAIVQTAPEGRPLIRRKHLQASRELGVQLFVGDSDGISFARMRYAPDYHPPVLNYSLISIPHGTTPNNDRKALHGAVSNHPVNSAPNRDGVLETLQGAIEFVRVYGEMLRRDPGAFVFERTSSDRTDRTFRIYRAYIKHKLGLDIGHVMVDKSITEIYFGGVDGMTIDDVRTAYGDEAGLKVEAFRKGHVTASFPKGSFLMYALRVRQWMLANNARFQGKTVVFFGHGTMTNAMDTLLRNSRVVEDPDSGEILWRSHHLKRGWPNVVVQADRAMGTTPAVKDPVLKGGIDLSKSEAGLNVRTANSGEEFTFDPALIRNMQSASGLLPVIINIEPLKSLPAFLGVLDPARGGSSVRPVSS